MDKGKSIEFAVKAIILKDGRFLALHRSDAKGSWFDLPGGRMEFGESAEETVIREVREETGLTIEPIRILDTWNNVREDYQVTGIFYLCIVSSDNTVCLSDEHDEYIWIDVNNLSVNDMHKVFKIKMECWNWNELLHGH